jgi:hypothetical protein
MHAHRARGLAFLPFPFLGSIGLAIAVMGGPARAEEPPVTTPSAPSDPASSLNAALTQPAGSWIYSASMRAGPISYSSYGFTQVFPHSLIYGFSDALQGSFTVQPLLTDNSYLRGTAALKASVHTGAFLALGAQAAFSLFRFHSASSDQAWSKVPDGTLFATACLSVDCASHVTAHFRAGLYLGGRSTSYEMDYGLKLLQRVGTHVKLRLDVEAESYKLGSGDLQKLPGFALFYGVRFFAADLAGDIGFTKPIAAGRDDGVHFGYPLAAVSYRWL